VHGLAERGNMMDSSGLQLLTKGQRIGSPVLQFQRRERLSARPCLQQQESAHLHYSHSQGVLAVRRVGIVETLSLINTVVLESRSVWDGQSRPQRSCLLRAASTGIMRWGSKPDQRWVSRSHPRRQGFTKMAHSRSCNWQLANEPSHNTC
jgi:hypothetical protein